MLPSGAFKRWYGIHKWTSLVCTLFLLMLCVTGLPLIFRDELSIWLGDVVAPPEHVTASAAVDLDAMVRDAQARRPRDAVKFLTRDDDEPLWFVSLGDTPTTQENTAVYLYDARTGGFLKEFPINEGLIHVLLTLHVEMFAGLPGTLFLGLMGLLFVASVVSGVVVYGPFMRKLPFGLVRSDRGPRLRWLDLHNLLGIATVIWVLVVGGTGVVNTLDRPLLGYWQMTEVSDMLRSSKDTPKPSALKPVDEAIRAAETAAPDMSVRFIAFPGTPFAGPYHYMVFMRGQTPFTARLLKPILIDAQTARAIDARNMPWYLTALLLSQPLHFGDYGGMPLKALWAVLDLITIAVLLSGLYLWWTKRMLSSEQWLGESDPRDHLGLEPKPRAS